MTSGKLLKNIYSALQEEGGKIGIDQMLKKQYDFPMPKKTTSGNSGNKNRKKIEK